MKTRLSFLMMAAIFVFSTNMFATNYYVSPNGNDSKDGLTPGNAKYNVANLNSMLKLGDTLFFLAGTYTLYDVSLTALDYTENNESANPQYITWKAYEDENGKAEVILSNPYGGWNGYINFAKGTAYRIFDGLTFKGPALPIDDPKNAINPETGKLVAEDGVHRRRCFNGTDNSGDCHHIQIRNCTFKDWPAQAIAFNTADFITIENCEIENCMTWSPWQNNVIDLTLSITEFIPTEAGTEERVVIRNNKIHDNVRRNVINTTTGLSSKSHGISIMGTGNLSTYNQFIIIENNLIYGNGGSGINIDATPPYVKIVNNTLYNNSVSTDEISFQISGTGSPSYIANNIIVAAEGKKRTQGNPGSSAAYNLFFGGEKGGWGNFGEVGGTGNVFTDPKFYNTTEGNINLMIQNDSPAIDAGNDTYAPILDFDGNVRVGKADIGAYENSKFASAGTTNLVFSGRWDSAAFEGMTPEYENLTSIDFTEVLTLDALPTMADINPNCLIYANNGIAANGNNNVVTFTDGSGSAEVITLKDGSVFCNTREFTAGTITYERDFTNMNADGWASICLPFTADMSDFDVKKFSASETKDEQTTVTFSKVNAEDVVANTPYIIKVPAAGKQNFVGTGLVPATTALSLEGETANGLIFKGNYNRIEAATELYLLQTDGSGFGKGIASSVIPAFRAYLQAADGSGFARNFALNFDGGGTTEIETPDAEAFTVYSFDGTLIINIANQQLITIYALDGRSVKSIQLNEGENTITDLAKGLYIINNRKVAVK